MNRSEELKSTLVRFLLVYARRQAERRLGELLRNEIARASPREPTTMQEFTDEIEKALADPAAENLRQTVKQAYDVLVGPPREVVTYEHLERVLDVLRNPSWHLQEACDAQRRGIRDALDLELRACYQRSSRTMPAEFQDCLNWIVRGSYEPIEDRIEKRSKSVTDFGIRDWARWPVGAGCHTWLCGARSPDIRHRLEAFGLIGRASHRELKNVHICGEAVSDYQGFIEGALRSAARAVSAIGN